MKIGRPFVSLLIIFLFICLFCAGCGDAKLYRRSVFYMGTTAEFCVYPAGVGACNIREACDEAEARIAALEEIFSIFKPSSVLSSINGAREKARCPAPKEVLRLLERSREYSALTEGAFDATVWPLSEIWGFGARRREDERAPGAMEIKEALSHVGDGKIIPDRKNGELIFNDPLAGLDFGGVAKGYAADEAAAIFKRRGIGNVLVNIGGDLYCAGTRPGADGWAIGIRDPEDRRETLAVLRLRDKAVATSGDYENFYIRGGRRYGHIIDPRTGDVARGGIASVTIVADDCATADALATAVFVLGEDKAAGLIETLAGVECFIVVGSGESREIITSSGIEKYLKRDGTRQGRRDGAK